MLNCGRRVRAHSAAGRAVTDVWTKPEFRAHGAIWRCRRVISRHPWGKDCGGRWGARRSSSWLVRASVLPSRRVVGALRPPT